MSKPKKRKFDPNFAPTGYIAVRANNSKFDCVGVCALQGTYGCRGAPCMRYDRPDGQYAYFVKVGHVKPKPKRSGEGWPVYMPPPHCAVFLYKTRETARRMGACRGFPVGRRRVRWEEV